MKKEIIFCPFMINRFGHPFLFFGIVGFGQSLMRNAPCLKEKCELWNKTSEMCSFKLIGENLQSR